MEVRVPLQIIYKITKPAPVSDVVASLLAAEHLLQQTPAILETLFPALHIERLEVSVSEISESSLKELLSLAVAMSLQEHLAHDVPAAITQLTGVEIPPTYDSIISLTFCLILFYAVDHFFGQISKGGFSKQIKANLDSLVAELSAATGESEPRIRGIVEAKLKPRIRIVAHSALQFFVPSKRFENAPILIGSRHIDRETVSEVPSDAQIAEADIPEMVQHHENVPIELHAQDIDRARVGWAAVIPKIAPNRVRMELGPMISPDDIYTRRQIRGDVMVVLSRKSDGSYKPSAIHLLHVRK